MWNYILRRCLLMIPTLFGVTVVSFVVMQLAPGDPLMNRMGAAGQSTQTRDAYLIQKRDLKLDKPLLLNDHYFRDHTEEVSVAAHYLGLTVEEIQAELPALAAATATGSADSPAKQRLKFIRSLQISDLDDLLASPVKHQELAILLNRQAIPVYCENLGVHGVPAAIGLLQRKDAARSDRIGAIRCLNRMITSPFVFTFSTPAKSEEAPAVVSVWKIWWDRNKDQFGPIDPDRKAILDEQITMMAKDVDSDKLYDQLQEFDRDDMPFFIERLFAETPPTGTAPESWFASRVVSAAVLKLYISEPLKIDVPLDAGIEEVDEVAVNWQTWYAPREQEFHPGGLKRVLWLFTDTQYGHMVWRLATFNFGRAALPPREPVSEKLWNAFTVSGPLMLMSQLVIYLVAVPIGVICAVNRGRIIDRGLTTILLFLYSVPPYVAGMLMLLLLCYGEYFKLFPMLGLHSAGAENLPLLRWIGDYLWHAALPLTCLSLFSLATMAMYSRSSMLDVFNQDYIRTARAKGVAESRVVFKHAFRNSLIPIITLFANALPAMLGGSVVVEVMFGINGGMGFMSWNSIEQKDFPTLMALLYVDAIVVMGSILLSDLLYVVADPRITFSSREST